MRAAALRLAPLAQVGPDRADDADDVDSAVVGEPLVFKRDNRPAQMRRDLAPGGLRCDIP